jgi:hypothetical protein
LDKRLSRLVELIRASNQAITFGDQKGSQPKRASRCPVGVPLDDIPVVEVNPHMVLVADPAAIQK